MRAQLYKATSLPRSEFSIRKSSIQFRKEPGHTEAFHEKEKLNPPHAIEH